ncbi:MAG: monovalent cation/H+ antiporter subunit D family protein [Maricaulaceae bacterium]|nr:monovalent cation/H+ antiporter subunit D family protein [Maricaulaceae bacterium]
MVAAPMLGAALATVLPGGRPAWVVALFCSLITAVFAFVLLFQTWGGEVISYAMGGWAPPLGIEFRIDGLNAPVLLLLGVLSLLGVIFALPSVADEIAPRKQSLFYATFLVCLTGLIGVTSTGDAFNMFVFLEISSIATYILVAMGAEQDRRALTASFNYLVLGTIGATFFVIGVGFLYMATGTLNMHDMALRLVELDDNRVVQVAFAFVIVGLGLKAAMFPLHVWLPNAYSFAPSFVTAFLASTATKVAFYTLIRFIFDVFSVEAPFVSAAFVWVIAALGVIGMIAASVQANFQTDARRLLAFSSVGQLGYMLLGLGIGTAAGVTAGVLHLLNHALMKGALFMALGVFAIRYGVRSINDLRGLGRTMPATASAFSVAGLSLVGIPMTVGFVSKWYLVSAALDRGWWWAVAAIAVSSLLALGYVGRLLASIWLQSPPERALMAAKDRIPVMMLAPMWVLAIANVWFFFDATPIVELARGAAEAALAGAPR